MVPGAGSQLGWLLWADALEPELAAACADRLCEPDILTAHGLRTLASTDPSFGPAKYHRGAVWPFDSWLGWGGLRARGREPRSRAGADGRAGRAGRARARAGAVRRRAARADRALQPRPGVDDRRALGAGARMGRPIEDRTRPLAPLSWTGYAALQARRRLLAHSRPAERDRDAGARHRTRRPRADAARRHRHRQDDDDGGHDRGRPAAGADHGPQQDAGGAAVQRVPDVLPDELGRVLRLLLRLLPARGLRPVAGPLHREGLGDQPGDRPAAPRGHGVPVRPSRRHHRRLGLLHLRPRLARDLQRQLPGHRQGPRHRSRRAAAQARLAAVQPQRHGARARHVPRARRDAGGLPGLRGDRVPRAAVRRRGRAPAALRPADGRDHPRRPRARRDLAGDALQRQGRHDGARRARDRPRAQRAHRRARGRGQAARVAPPAPAHAVRHGDAQGGRVLLGHRELLADPGRP